MSQQPTYGTLKFAVRTKIMNEVFKTLKQENVWRVFVVDKLSMRMVSACLKMSEIMNEGITLVEDLNKLREPLRTLEVIYLITPTHESITKIIADFSDIKSAPYKAAHVFLTEALSDELFSLLSRSPAVSKIKTLKEINIAFLPYESQVFSLDNDDLFPMYYAPESDSGRRQVCLDRCAEQIATLCATLSEYPAIRYRVGHEKNMEFAQLVQHKLDAYKADDPTMGDGHQKDRSTLIILDRGFDPMTPLLHDLYYQAMVHDLLNIQNDTYSYQAKSGMGEDKEKEVLLDENDEIWVAFRHKHIANVGQDVTKSFKEFASQHRGVGDNATAKDVANLVKRMPQHQKELSKHATHLNLASVCMNLYQTSVEKLCKVEQDLAMGADASGDKVKDALRIVSPILLEPFSVEDKVRMILIYTLHKQGITEENLKKLVEFAQLEEEEKQVAFNLQNLSVSVIQESGRKGQKQMFNPVNRRERELAQTYQTSRWTPYITDIMEEAIDDKLDQRAFPYLGGGRSARAAPASARYGNWRQGKGQESAIKTCPRLIVFIIGGMSFPEMRAAYEVTNSKKNWEVLIGSGTIMTPKKFVISLREMGQNVGPLQQV